MNNIGNRSIHELIMRMPCLAWPIGSTVSGKPFLQCSYFLDGRATSWRKNCLLIELLQLFQSQHLHGIGYHVLIFRIHDWILVPTNGCRNELANGQWKSSTEPPFLIDITNEGLVKKKCPKVCVTNIPPFLFDTAPTLELWESYHQKCCFSPNEAQFAEWNQATNRTIKPAVKCSNYSGLLKFLQIDLNVWS